MTRMEGVFSMIHGDPPADSGRPAAQYMLTMTNGTVVPLDVAPAQLEAFEGGRALQGQRIVIHAEIAADRPFARVCTIAKA